MNQGWGCALLLASIFVSFVGFAIVLGIFAALVVKAYEWVM